MGEYRNDSIKKWYTVIEAVDQDTGEIITQRQVETKEYIIIARTIKYEINHEKKYGTRRITWECEINRQQRLFATD